MYVDALTGVSLFAILDGITCICVVSNIWIQTCWSYFNKFLVPSDTIVLKEFQKEIIVRIVFNHRGLESDWKNGEEKSRKEGEGRCVPSMENFVTRDGVQHYRFTSTITMELIK